MKRKQQTGFTLIETMLSLAVLLVVTAIVMTGMTQMMFTQGTIANRTEMHTTVRSATELLEQEIGQAGKVSLSNLVTLNTAVVLATPDTPVTQGVTLSSVAGMFDQEQLVIDTGINQETVTISCGNPCTNPVTATFSNAHAGGVPVTVQGGFATGIVPDGAWTAPNGAAGSDGTHLKLYGDIDGSGNMVYVEYWCDVGTGRLYRNEMPFDTPPATFTGVDASKVLLSNLQANPGGTPCFTYQKEIVGPYTFVTDVAVTLTEQTQNPDPQTGAYQTETKALLNVSPRNVYNAWELANADLTDRVQPMPPTVTALLPLGP